ncbi:hypothetical protein KYG33_05965 [Chryseobacterium sp. D764]|uniref:DUF5675 family protein n=1 Tax=unclassified Chryseobacterium TaxID=2593645 RepID=UPI00111584DD|nr:MULTISPECIES: DUF5675 family protein [unclassified Chryseobacterium]QXU50584.1 hypothetical protein KYG33_05965 [Chryseobacterium sp. D764]
MKTTLLVIVLTAVFSGSLFGQRNFEIVIERKLSSAACTLGYLIADKKVICHTLELPWENNTKNISCIPPGSYNGILRYDKNDGWRIQLENVPDRDGVQIHMGNYTKQIKGCVLVGMETDIKSCTVGNSKLAYSKLKDAFYGTSNPNSTPDKNIIVTFK